MNLRASSLLAVAVSLLATTARAQEPPVPAPPAEPTHEPEPPEHWHSGYHNGSFYIRSPDDIFRLYVDGRVHVDLYDAFGPGLSGLAPGGAVQEGFELRRARLELAGEFFERWQWQLGAEFAPSTDSNLGGTTGQLTCKASATTSALTCTPQSSAVDSPTAPKPAPTDAFINYAPSPWANVQVGQFYLPFTMENRISDNTTPFLERALVVRTIGAPLQRDIGAMFWGESPDRLFYYSVGIFNGDGPNSPNVDNDFDFAGQAFVRPFVQSSAPMKWARLGVSGHTGTRDSNKVGYDMPALTTQQGFAFWKPTYTDSFGRLMHILPSGEQEAVAGDLYVPITDKLNITGEVVYSDYHTREAVDGYQLTPFTERLGALSGYGAYGQVTYWVIGDQEIIGQPSYGRPIHVDLGVPQQQARHGVQLLARFDTLDLKYKASVRGGQDDPKTPSGDVVVNSVSLGGNYWATRHLRVSLNYGYYKLPTHSTLPEIHEVSARVGVQF